MPDTVQDKLPDLATIQPDRLIKCHISEDRYSGEVLLPGLWYTDFDRKTGGQWSFWAISKTFEAVNLYGWMNGLLFYYDLVSGRDRTFFNASNVIRLNRKASEINYDSYYGLNRPFRFTLCVSYIGRTSFTLSVVMFDHLTGEKYGDCNSTIVYVDTKTRRPVPLPEDLIVGAKTALEKLKVKPYNVEKSGIYVQFHTYTPTQSVRQLNRYIGSCTASSRNITNGEVRKKRNVLFEEERNRQLALVKRIEKIQVEYKGHPENCTLLMNKNLSTPYNCAMHINEFLMKRSVLALVNSRPWDMHRPLEEDCELQLLHMLDEDAEVQNKTFWRTCAFLLGHLLETSFKDEYYIELCSFPKPQVEKSSFAHDVDLKLPNWKPKERELLALSLEMNPLIAKDCHFERLKVSESVAIAMFEDNRFKRQQIPEISEKSEDQGTVTVYRVGEHIDICRGPLISTTGQIGRFAVSAVHDVESDTYGKLKRFQGLALPRDISMHYWTWEFLLKHSKRLNRSFIPGSYDARLEQSQGARQDKQQAIV